MVKGIPRTDRCIPFVSTGASTCATSLSRLIAPLGSVLGDFFTPAFQCPHRVERIGTLGDGGKWVCGLNRVAKQDKCVIYSFGLPHPSTALAPHMLILTSSITRHQRRVVIRTGFVAARPQLRDMGL